MTPVLPSCSCPECHAEAELIIRGWPSLVCPGFFVRVVQCWECGYKRAVHTPLIVRPITQADSALLLSWRNDPESRVQSFSSSPLTLAVHQIWVKAMSELSTPHAWIGEIGGEPVGSVRISLTTPPVVSLVVAPQWRGNRIGVALLAAAPIPQGAIATIKADNVISRKVFAQAGFLPTRIEYVKRGSAT